MSLELRFLNDLAAGAVNNLSGSTEDEARRELVSWASRLEFESMDLRDKAKVLSAQLLKNSNTLSETKELINRDFKDWKETALEPINELCVSLKKINDSIKSMNTLIGKQKKQLEEDVIGNGYSEMIQMLRSISNQLDQLHLQRTNPNNIKNIIKDLINEQNKKNSKEFNKIISKLDQLENKNKILMEKFNNQLITPNSSFVETRKKKRNKTHPRKILNDDDFYISLLSDDYEI